MFVTAIAATFSPNFESLAKILLRALSTEFLSAAFSLLKLSVFCEYAISWSLQAASKGSTPGSLRASLSFSLVPGPQYWYPGMCNFTVRLLMTLFKNQSYFLSYVNFMSSKSEMKNLI